MRKAPPYQIYWEEMNEIVEEEVDDTIPAKIDVICVQCRDRVGYVNTEELSLPLMGSMFHPHPGCEGWYMPGANETAQYFVCPHAAHEEGDQHLFLQADNNQPEESSLLMTSDHKMFDVRDIIGNCPCGCGRMVSPGNKYADGIRCFNRVRQMEKRDA